MELEKSSLVVDVKDSSNRGRFIKTVRALTRVFKPKVSEKTRQRILQAEELYNAEVKLRKEAEEALVKIKQELDGNKLLHESCSKEEQKKLAKALDKYEMELRHRKDIEIVLSIELEKIDKLKIQLATLENKHNVMIEKAEEFKIKYMEELIRKEALTKENQELVEAYKRDVDVVVSALREEKDNALERLDEITTKQEKDSQTPASFVCPLSLEVMEDPQIAADGYTYEAEDIRKWFRVGDTSPMTNLKLSHRRLVPNRALQSAIQEFRLR